MFFRLIILACIVSLFPSMVGAQEVGVLLNSQPAERRAVGPPSPVNLMPTEEAQTRVLLAANDLQGNPAAEEQRARKTHSGLTFSEFVDVHFGEYRWIYWAVAGAILVAIHAN